MRTDEDGDALVVIARVDDTAAPADQVPAYVEKYRAAITRLGSDSVAFAGEYSVAIRLTPTKLRAW